MAAIRRASASGTSRAPACRRAADGSGWTGSGRFWSRLRHVRAGHEPGAEADRPGLRAPRKNAAGLAGTSGGPGRRSDRRRRRRRRSLDVGVFRMFLEVGDVVIVGRDGFGEFPQDAAEQPDLARGLVDRGAQGPGQRR